LRNQSDYPYASEDRSHLAMTKWLAQRRARAHTPITVDPDHLATYVGRYRLAFDPVLTLNRGRDRLTLDFPGPNPFALLPRADEKFFLKVMDLELTFARDRKGRVSYLDIDYEGQKLNATRVD